MRRQSRGDLATSGLLGAVAGGVDAAGWICLAGLLPSHLTASLVMLGAQVAEYDVAEVRARVAMLPVFVCTVAGVRWLARWLGKRQLPVLPVLLTVMSACLALFCAAGALSDGLLADDPRMLILIGGVGVASMAVQNAIMRLCLPQLCPTTVMTGNLTQTIMAGVDLLARRHLGAPELERDARTRLLHAGCPLIGFVLGCISCGSLASRHGLICLTIPLALALAASALAWQSWRRTTGASEASRDSGQPLLFPIALLPRSS